MINYSREEFLVSQWSIGKQMTGLVIDWQFNCCGNPSWGYIVYCTIMVLAVNGFCPVLYVQHKLLWFEVWPAWMKSADVCSIFMCWDLTVLLTAKFWISCTHCGYYGQRPTKWHALHVVNGYPFSVILPGSVLYWYDHICTDRHWTNQSWMNLFSLTRLCARDILLRIRI